jgi:ATP-dependent Clp protease ATP-binding subunit ClpC
MFGSEDALIRLDMSEFMESHTVARLVGAPPGYVGFDEGGQLTEAVRHKSYCCILFDEIEKAHENIFNILLQIFDDGHLTDAKGRRVDFRNSIIVMTSNIGAELIKKGSSLGFTAGDESKAQEQSYERMKENLLNELKKRFRPEFLNRIDAVVVFHSLTKEHIRKIVDLMLSNVSKQLAEKEIKLEVTDAAKDFLGEKGYDKVFGARPLRRVIQNLVEDKLSDAVLSGGLKRFPKVFEVEAEVKKITSTVIDAEMSEITSSVIDAIKAMKGVLSVKSSGDLLTVYCSKDLKPEIEKTIKDNGGFLVNIKVNSYISKALVDVEENEIVLKSGEELTIRPEAVEALPRNG